MHRAGPARWAPCSVALRGVCVLLLSLGLGAAWPGARAAHAEDQAQSQAPSSLAQLEAAFTAAPTDVVQGLALQDRQLADLRRDGALRWWRKHQAARPDDLVAAFLLARLEAQGATAEKALESMGAALEARLGLPEGAPGLAEAWLALADAEAAVPRAERAAQACERSLALRAAPAVWHRLGGLRESLGQLPEAEKAYRQAVALAKEWDPPLFALALLLARTHRSGEAQRLMTGATTRRPDAAETWLHLGLVLALSGRKADAAEAYQKAFERAGRDATALTALAASYGEIEEHALAAQALEAALRIDPGHELALVQAAALAVKRADWAEAKRLLGRAAQALPRSAQVAFLQGVTLERTGSPDAALGYYRKAVQLDPAATAYALALASLLIERGSYDAATTVLKQVAERCPADPDVQLRLGFCAIKRRAWTAAVDAFRLAAQLAPKDPDPHLYLAVVFGDHLSDLDQALRHLTEYRRLGGRTASALAWLRQLEAAQAASKPSPGK